jgi:hypothetical protein
VTEPSDSRIEGAGRAAALHSHARTVVVVLYSAGER